jgi:hypothetical protein
VNLVQGVYILPSSRDTIDLEHIFWICLAKMSRRFIVEGEILRQSSSPGAYYFFSSRRLLFIITCVGLLVVTNPQNRAAYEAATSVFGKPLFDPNRLTNAAGGQRYPFPKRTNYGIFSLEEHLDGVVFVGGLQQWKCSYYDESIGFLCEHIGTYTSTILHKR